MSVTASDLVDGSQPLDVWAADRSAAPAGGTFLGARMVKLVGFALLGLLSLPVLAVSIVCATVIAGPVILVQWLRRGV